MLRRYDLSKTKTFREHPQRMTLETFETSDIRVMRRHDLQKDNDKDNVKNKYKNTIKTTKTMTKTFREHPQRL